jgi:hypothetical protein
MPPGYHRPITNGLFRDLQSGVVIPAEPDSTLTRARQATSIRVDTMSNLANHSDRSHIRDRQTKWMVILSRLRRHALRPARDVTLSAWD